MMRNRRTVLVVLVVAVVFGAAAWAIARATSSKKYTEVSKKQAEQGGPKELTINNTAKLITILLPEQFTAAKKQLASYIAGKYNGASSASIASDPVVNGNGLITFTVSVDNTSQKFGVALDRTTYFDKLVVSVPTDNYSATVQVYGGGD